MLGRFVRNPRTVGAVAASSRALARQMLSGLDVSGAVSLVELGPGTGVVTREIASRLGPDARCLAIDIDAHFVERLHHRFPRIDVACGSAAQLRRLLDEHGYTGVDHIISGLPFASLPGMVTGEILTAVADVLPVGGTFTTFQYVHGYLSPLASTFRRELSALLNAQPTRIPVWRNVPPAYVLRWRRQ